MSDDARPGTVIVVASDAMRGARVEAALRELTGWRRIVCTPARLRALCSYALTREMGPAQPEAGDR